MSAATDHDTASRLDFVEGMRRHNYCHHVRDLIASYPERMAATGVRPTSWREVAPLYDTDPAYLFSCAVQRGMQEIAWAAASASASASASAGSSAGSDGTADADPAGEGDDRPLLDPDLELPAWYTRHSREGRDDIHLVPGGYWGNRQVGEIYHRGGAVYRLAWRAGYDARPGALEAFARLAPADAGRIVDLGCAFGGATRVFARSHPDAEVIGIDLSAPALRYAHRLTRAAGLTVSYRQADAEATGLADDSVDVVTAFLLLHEVPTDVRLRILTEAHRILTPGGTLLFLDIPPYQALSPVEAFFESFDDRGNGEHFWTSFLDTDFPAVLRDLGYTDVADGPLDYREDAYWGSAALWRTGEFNPVHRWVTTARKPSQEDRG